MSNADRRHPVTIHARPRGAGWCVRAALIFLCVFAASGSTAFAADFIVTKTADTSDGTCDADCSLREAIVAANANAGADRIVLGAAQTYTLSVVPAVLAITDGLTIDGNGSTVNAAGLDRVFDIQGAFAVIINNLTITGGTASGVLSLGGGISIRGASVVLNNCIVTGNSTALETGTRDDGGGIAAIGSYDAATAVATLAGLTLNNTLVSGNAGSNGGGILCVLCALSISGSSISGNTASGGDGGGIDVLGNSSSLSMTSSALTGNTVSGGAAQGGGLSVPFGSSMPTLSRNRIVANTGIGGGAIFTNVGTVTATNNWWGCNFGPGTTGARCAAAPNGVSGPVTTSPYLVLKASASSLIVLPGATATMTAGLTVNSSNLDTSAGGTVPNGISVAFSSAFGVFATPMSPTTNGKATDLYTASSATVATSLSATVDGQTVAPPGAARSDFDSDQEADIAVFRPSTGTWYVRYSGTPTSAAIVWGGGGDVPVARDYDGDGKIDIAVWRPSNGTWYIRYSGSPTSAALAWGGGGDVPVPADYDGDGIADIAVWRPSTGTWYIRYSGSPTSAALVWGGVGDVPVAVDFDGDGKTDIAVFRPSTGTWYIRYSGSPTSAAIVWGGVGDVPVPVDFDGDRKADIAVWRPSTGTWYIRYSGSPTSAALVWGGGSDVPVAGDFDGDGQADIAVWRPSNGTWYIRYTGSPTSAALVWGGGADIPILKGP